MYYLVECLLIKNENQYLLEHLRDNVQAGIEHFYIYDNNSDVSVESFLSDYPELQKLCTIEIFPDTENKQIDCYKHFLDTHRNDSIYCAFVDTDEMFEGDLKELLKTERTVYTFRSITHGSNGKAFYEDKTLKERFYTDTKPLFSYVKNIVKLSDLITQLPHESICINNDKCIVSRKDVKLHHYYYKSFEEFLWKIKRGVIQKKTVRILKYFFTNNNNLLSEKDIKAVLNKYNVDLNFKTIKNGREK